AVDIDGDGIDDLGFWVPDNGLPSTKKAGDWYFILSGGVSLAEHSTYNVVHYQFGSSVGLPLTGTFAATTTSGIYPPVMQHVSQVAAAVSPLVTAVTASAAPQPAARSVSPPTTTLA